MPTLPAAEALALVVLTGAFAGLLSGAATWRRGAAVLVALALLPFAFLAEGAAWLRGLVALSAWLVVFRVLDLARLPGPMWSPARRVWHLLSVVDSRRVARASPRLDTRASLRVLAFAVPTWVGLWLALRVARSIASPLGAGLAWLGAVVFCYASFEVVAASVELAYAAAGRPVPMLHDAPIQSRTLAEFWGQRWNRIVSGWLRATCFMPLARRGRAVAGGLLAFAVSVALHAHVAWVTLGPRAALVVGAFFALQVPLLTLERILGVARWSPIAARAWTLGLLLLASPLFVLPALAVFDPILR